LKKRRPKEEIVVWKRRIFPKGHLPSQNLNPKYETAKGNQGLYLLQSLQLWF